MNNLNFRLFRSTFLLFSFILSLLISSCSQQRNVGVVLPSIPALTKLKDNPTKHYLELSQISSSPSPENSSLDLIAFPEKAHATTIKLFSSSYLERSEIRAIIKKLKPPANSSKQTRGELDFLLDVQKNRTEEEVSEALRMHDIVYFPMPSMKKDKDLFFEIFEIYGSEFNPDQYPKTRTLLAKMMKDMRITEFTAKNHFLRARPRQLESKLKPLKKMSSSSFASGHTLWAYMQAYILAELIPTKREEFLQLAFEIGYTREILGVHYPSDEEASRKLAHWLLKEMWNKESFIRDFHAAQLEWKN